MWPQECYVICRQVIPCIHSLSDFMRLSGARMDYSWSLEPCLITLRNSPPHETNDVLVSQVVPRSRSRHRSTRSPCPLPSPAPPPTTYGLSFGSRGSGRSLHKHKEICQRFSLPQDPDDVCSGALGKPSAVCSAHGEDVQSLPAHSSPRGRGLGVGVGPALGGRWLPGHGGFWLAFLSSGFDLVCVLLTLALLPLRGRRPHSSRRAPASRALPRPASSHSARCWAGGRARTASISVRPLRGAGDLPARIAVCSCRAGPVHATARVKA